jgi:hypothetical protein
MSALTEFLFPAPAPRSVGKIISWWERRRLFYNAAVGAAGLGTLGVLTVAVSVFEGGLALPPWQPVVVFGAMANVCYSLGPCVEILAHRLWGRSVLPVGPSLYRMGLTFAVGLALFPALLVILFVVERVVVVSLPG